MTSTFGPQISNQSIIDAIYYWIDQDNWAPGIAFPSGPTLPIVVNPPFNPNDPHEGDFFYRTTTGHLHKLKMDDQTQTLYWADLGEPSNLAITDCRDSLPVGGTEGQLINKYDEGNIYQYLSEYNSSTNEWDFAWRNIGSNKNGLPLSTAAINFTDASKSFRSANLGLLISDDGSSPLLATDSGFVVKKDLTAGGFIGTNQGEVWIGHGRRDKTDVPKIILMHAEPAAYSPGYGILYIKQRLYDAVLEKWTDTTPGHLDLGNLTAHGDITVEKDTPQITLKATTATDASIIYYDNNEQKMNLSYSADDDLLFVWDARAALVGGQKRLLSLTPDGDLSVYRHMYTQNNVSVGANLNVNGVVTSNLLVEKPSATLTLKSTTATDAKIQFYDANVHKMNLGYDTSNDWLFVYDILGSKTLMSLTHAGDLDVYHNITAGGYLNGVTLRVGGTEIVSAGRTLYNVVANANIITAGTVATARLGSGTASSSTYLRGDQTWAAIPTAQWTAGAVNLVVSPLFIGGDSRLYISQAGSGGSGYLTSTDWNTFNNKYGSGSTPTFNGINMNGNIIPTVAGSPSTGYYCGSSSYPWKMVDTYYLYANTLNALSGGTMNVGCTLALGNNTLTTSNGTVITNLNADKLDGYHASSFVTSGSAPTFGDVTLSKTSPTLNLTCTSYTNFFLRSHTDNKLYFSKTGTNLVSLDANGNLTLLATSPHGNLYVTGGATIQNNLGVNGTLTTGGLNISNPTISNVTGSRQLSIDRDSVYYNYYNTSGRVKLVHVSVVITGVGANGYYSSQIVLAWSTGWEIIANAQNDYCTRSNSFTFLVPNGWSYQIKDSSAAGHTGGVTIQSVHELTL